MLDREHRIVRSCKVEFERLGKRVTALTEDVSLHGLFLRTTEFLPVGEVVELSIFVTEGPPVVVISRVAHLLSEAGARALGRQPGMGFEFLDREGRHDPLRELIDEATPPPRPLMRILRVLVADESPRLLERVSNALGHGGFRVEIAANGAEAYSVCQAEPPDILLIADKMPVMDGWTLIKMLALRPRLAEIPVLLMSEDAGDITRLAAYRLGVRDFIQKPFTNEELCLRLHQLARPGKRTAEHVILRGKLAELALGTLLSLLDFEHKSGLLLIMTEKDSARLFVAEGRVVKIEPTRQDQTPHKRLMEALDWRAGTFEFIVCDVVGKDEIGKSTAHLLLEHAQLRDENKAPSSPPKSPPPKEPDAI